MMKIILTGLIAIFSCSIANANTTLQWDTAKYGPLPEKYWGKLTEYHYGKNDAHAKFRHVMITIKNTSDPNNTRTLVVAFGDEDLAFASTLHSAVGKIVRFENDIELTILASEQEKINS